MTETQMFVEGSKLCIIGEDGNKYCFERTERERKFTVKIKSIENKQVGETLTVTVEIKSQYLTRQNEFLRLFFNGTLVDSRNVHLDPNEEVEIEFTYELQQGDGGEARVIISAKSDKDIKDIEIARETTGNIDIAEFRRQKEFPIEGESMSFFATIQNNTGSDIEGAVIRFEIPDEVYVVELEIDIVDTEEKEFTFIWETEEGDAGQYDAKLETGNQTEWVNPFEVLGLSDTPLIVVNIIDTSSPVDPSKGEDTLIVDIQATNVGPERSRAGIKTKVKDENITLSPIFRVALDSKQKAIKEKTWGITSEDVGEHLIISESYMPP